MGFLREEYTSAKTLVWNAIDCIRHVFNIKTSPKNDFCRLFCKFGLLEPLSRKLADIALDTTSQGAKEYVVKIGTQWVDVDANMYMHVWVRKTVSLESLRLCRHMKIRTYPHIFSLGEILYWFSQGDPVVRAHFARPAVLRSMLHLLPHPSLSQGVCNYV